MRLLVAVQSRDVKAALFMALTGVESVSIVGTATTTAELISLARALRPEVVIVECDLPGESVIDALDSVSASTPDCRMMTVGIPSCDPTQRSGERFETFTDVDQLLSVFPASGALS